MKKVVNFLVCALWAFGTIGGVGYGLYEGAYPIAAGCLVNGILALPTVKQHFEDLTD